MRILVLASLLFSTYFLPLDLSAATHEFTLKNDLKLIVREDHRAPIAIFQIWYKVGSSYEPVGLTGISHALEHMMFKGTEKIGPNKFAQLVSEQGGAQNAFTSQDYTGYYQILEASRLALSFELEADRMQNLLLNPQEFAKEIQVVMEERRLRTEDNPNATTFERFMAAAYVSSNYRNPTIGWMHDLQQLQAAELKTWYQQWYVPNNATIVIVGDVDAKHMLSLAERYFGDIVPAKKFSVVKPLQEVTSLGERRLTVKIPAQLPALYMGFNTPALKTAQLQWEPYALRMLAGVLDSGYSARIETELVRKQQIAAGASASYNAFSRGDALFILTGIPVQGHSIQELEQALLAQIEQLKLTPPSAKEMDRVKAQVIAGLVYSKDSISEQALQIGNLESIGLSWRLIDEEVARLKAITPQQVQQVAKKYLIREHLTVATLDPQPLNTQP